MTAEASSIIATSETLEEVSFELVSLWEKCRKLGLPGFEREASGVAIRVVIVDSSAIKRDIIVQSHVALRGNYLRTSTVQEFRVPDSQWPENRCPTAHTAMQSVIGLLVMLRHRAEEASTSMLSKTLDAERLRTELRKVLNLPEDGR